ncbi:MAG: response regulator [Lachnospiraceae bacterium]|nr:response regulator [Lachnospiraceae bacterium]
MFNVLFVDDDCAIGYIVSKYTCWNNSEFVLKKIVNNAMEALRILETETYDLVITDIRMPVMDGLEFIRELRQRNINIAVVLSSTYSDFQYAREGMRLGALDYVSKPLTESKLVEELEYISKYLREQKIKEQRKEGVLKGEILEEVFQGVLENSSDLEQMADKILNMVKKKGEEKEQDILMLKKIAVSICSQLVDNYPWIKNFFIAEIELKEESYEEDFKDYIKNLGQFADRFQLNTSDNRINQICKLLFLNIEESKVLDIVAERLELNKDYISVLFKNATNIGLNKYITMMKMEYAKVLLKGSNLKIYEISEKCGYTTIDYFSQLFKKHTGKTPLQYRKYGSFSIF